MASGTYGDVLARNIRAARSRVDIGQENLAARMRVLGFRAWIRQTVGATERGRRRPTAEEIVGLAFALETTISRLMAPGSDDPELVQLQLDGPGVPVDWVRLSATTDRRVGELAWHDDKPVRNTVGDRWSSSQADFVQDLVNRISTGRPLPDGTPTGIPPLGVQPVVAAVVTSDRGVLVGKRRDGKPPWTFIAGEVEPGELPEDAAVREVKEETGLEVRAGRLIGERNPHPATGRHMIYMAAEPTRGTDIFVGDEAELTEVRWVSLAEADEMLPGMFEPVREHLERELGGEG